MTQQTTEEKILAAAEKEFLSKGFVASRTTSIAKEAGVTHAMLHYYFRSKENLFDKIISNKMSLLGELMLDSMTKSNLPLFERIRMTINRHLDFLSVNPELPFFLMSEIRSHPESLNNVIEILQANADNGLGKLQREINETALHGECRNVDARILMLDIVSLNVFSFIAQPVVEKVLPGLFADKERFIEQRKIENFETIMRKLKI